MSFLLIFFIFLRCRFKTMYIYLVDLNTMLAAVCYNVGKPNLSRVQVNVMLVDLKDLLDQINWKLNKRDTRRVNNVGYRRPSIDTSGRLQFSQMMLKNDDNVRNMFVLFGQHNTCSQQSSWMFCCWDLPKIFLRVWFSLMKIRLYYYVVSLFCWN